MEATVKACCWSYMVLQKEYIICPVAPLRCQRAKKIMIKQVAKYCNQRFSLEALSEQARQSR